MISERQGKEIAGDTRDRDRELAHYVGRHGAVSIAHVMAATGVGRAAAYRRVARLEEAGLIERVSLLGFNGVLRATRKGLAYAGLGLSVASVSPANAEHYLCCASTALRLADRFGEGAVLSEREIAFTEALEERPIASAVLSGQRARKPRSHRADLAVLREAGTIAVEVELTPKAPKRLEAIARAWRLAVANGTVNEVHYVCEPGKTYRAVSRAVERVRAQNFVAVIEGVPGI